MSNPAAQQTGTFSSDAPDTASPLDVSGQLGSYHHHNSSSSSTNNNHNHSVASSQSMLATLSIQSSASSSSAHSPTSKSYMPFESAGAKGISAMRSRLTHADYYSGSSSSPLDGEFSEDIPSSASFGAPGSGGDALSGSTRRGGHAGHGNSLLAHKDSFGGVQGSFPAVSSARSYATDSVSSTWRSNEALYDDNSRQQSYSRKRRESGDNDLNGGPFGCLGTHEDSKRDGVAATPASPPSEPFEIMGSVSGGRGYLTRSGSTSNGRRVGGSVGAHHTAKAASLSAAAAAALPPSSTSLSGSSELGASPDGRLEQLPTSVGPIEGGRGGGISRSESVATDMAPTAPALRERKNTLSPGLSAIDTAGQPANGTSASSGVPPLSPGLPAYQGSDSLHGSSQPVPPFSTAASSAAAEGTPTLRQVRASRQAGASAIQLASKPEAASSSSRTARPDPSSSRSASHGVASESRPSGSTSTRERSGRDRSDRDRDRSAAAAAASSTSERHGSSSAQPHHTSSSKGEASGSGSRGAKSASRTLPQLPSAPNMKPAPPPAMYWSKAPVHGSVPRRSFRAHTTNLCEEVMWLFGGCDSKGCFRDLWCFDTETMCWSKPKVTGDVPPARRAHSSTMVNQRLFVFAGGDGPNYFNDLYIFDTVSLRWFKPEVSGTPPSPRRAHTCNYHEGQLIVFGGGNGVGALNDVHTLDVHDLAKLEWRKLECKGKIPIGRGYHTTNLVDGKLIVIGGSDGHMSFNDIHILRLDTRTWYQVKTDEIHNRLGHTATQVGSYLFVFGGHDSKTYTDELLMLNLVNLQWEPRRVCGSKPPGRGYHQAWLRDSRLFVHGGFDGKDIFDDLHYLDLAACAYLPQITSFTVELDDE